MPSPFALAIGAAEGFGQSGSRPQRNNNPGDLKNWGSFPVDAGGYTIFPSLAAGWAALEQQLAKISAGTSAYYSPDMSIAQMGQVWADGDANWASNVAAYLGVSTAAMIGPLISGNVPTGNSSPAPQPVVTVTDPQTGAVVATYTPGGQISPADALLLAGAGIVVLLIARRFFS